MDELEKKHLLIKAKKHVVHVSSVITHAKQDLETSITKLRHELIRARGEERDTKEGILYFQLEKQDMLGTQTTSPYFFRCDVQFDDEKSHRTLYFGKFPFVTESIYSWVAPVSTIRFESPGTFSYQVPNEGKRSGRLLRKDQYMIVDKKIIFMSSESTEYARELIYQEYFSQRKTGFVLPEIVEQMEKAQDSIIRSHYFGSFLISGPAGSGKTTLALHKLAYLIQSPDTSDLFPEKQLLVFVQDTRAKDYFGSLLPQLGIHKVKITTFDEWAIRLLGLTENTYIQRFGRSEKEKDIYESQKYEALKNFTQAKLSSNIYGLLETMYRKYFTDTSLLLFEKQQKTNTLDRFDLTILLILFMKENNGIFETIEKWVKQRNDSYVKKQIRQLATYKSIIIDEAENYLVEQITLIKSCIDPKTKSIVYVGDLVQQTLPFTIRGWTQVQEDFLSERKVTLYKVYRNTKQVLEYIKSIGYDVVIPDEIKTGEQVKEIKVTSKKEELHEVFKLLDTFDNHTTIGILAKSEAYLTEYKRHFKSHSNINCMTINEAQGVEFDTVILVGVNKDMFSNTYENTVLKEERKKVDHDLIYVALTRAMNSLYILGTTPLKDLLHY